MDSFIGKTVSHYEILEKLGEGGMGVVYKAHDTRLDRFVALKFLPQRLSSSEEEKARFFQEAKAAAALNHPNVCSVIDIQDHDGQLFIVMELVDGQTLSDRKGSLTLKQGVDIGIQIADGLAAAHEKGIVHRDIKPENIMVRRDGIVQIMDFGVAKLRGVSRLTREGSTIGTAGYMSPEVIQGQDADPRSDIFSLGVVLYEMFTGLLPFRGLHETAVSYEIVNVDPPAMSTVKPGIDPALEGIVSECLEKDPNERTQSARQVSVDLTRFKRETGRSRVTKTMGAASPQVQQGASTGDMPPKGTGLKRLMWEAGIGIAFLAALLIVLTSGLLNESRPKEVVRFSYNLPSGARLAPIIDISPDGRRFAYFGINAGRHQLYIQDLASLESLPVPGTESLGPISGTEGTEGVFFSPDGEWLGFVSEGQMKKIQLRGGSSTTLAPASYFRGASWGDDNTIVYAPSPTGGLWRLSAFGGTPQPVTAVDSSAGETSHRYPNVLPGSKAVLFTVKTNTIARFSEAKIAVQRFDSKQKKVLIDGGSFARYVPTGHIVFGRGGSLYAVPFDLDRLEVKGTPVQVLEGGRIIESWGVMTVSVSRTGTIVYDPSSTFWGDSNRVVLYDRTGKGTPLFDSPDNFGCISLSPDRQRFTSYIAAANDDIWVYDIPRHLRTRFTFGGGNNWFPLWSPDGKHIVFTGERGGAANLFWKPVDGSVPEERLARSPERQIPTSWSSDGRVIAYHQANVAGNFEIWVLPMDGDRTPRPFLHSQFSQAFGAFSPDGRWLTYQSNESGQNEVYAVPFPKGEGKWQISTGGGTYPAWGKDGREIIYYRGSTKSFMRVPITFEPELHPGRSEELFRVPATPIYTPNITPDGEHIAVVLPGTQQMSSRLVVVVNWFEELKKLAKPQ